MGYYREDLYSQYTHLRDVELEVEYLTSLHLDSDEIAEKAKRANVIFEEFLETIDDLARSLDALSEGALNDETD